METFLKVDNGTLRFNSFGIMLCLDLWDLWNMRGTPVQVEKVHVGRTNLLLGDFELPDVLLGLWQWVVDESERQKIEEEKHKAWSTGDQQILIYTCILQDLVLNLLKCTDQVALELSHQVARRFIAGYFVQSFSKETYNKQTKDIQICTYRWTKV